MKIVEMSFILFWYEVHTAVFAVQPLYSGRLTCPRLILPHFEPPKSGHLSTPNNGR